MGETAQTILSMIIEGHDKKQQENLEVTAGHIANLMKLETAQIMLHWELTPLAIGWLSLDLKKSEYISISRSFLESLDQDEIEAVLAHEFAHYFDVQSNGSVALEQNCDLIAAKTVGKTKVLKMLDAMERYNKKFNSVLASINIRRAYLQNAKI